MDHDAYRRDSRRRWGEAARGWHANRDLLREAMMPVAGRMVDAIAPQPGHRVLELAAGTGEVGFLAAELIRPGGELICSDFAPEMLTAAQERAVELGVDNVRFRQIDAESIDLPAASVDGVLCRWGYMLLADPEAALRETRRVLRSGGRLALAAWAEPDTNPWSSLVGSELVRRGAVPRPEPGQPGQFAWAREEVIAEHLAAAGFVDDIEIGAVDIVIPHADFDTWWRVALDLGSRTAEAVAAMAPGERDDVRAALAEAARPFEQPDGSYRFPGRSWVAAASG